MSDPDLSRAYAIRTPEDCARIYADWAASYDDGFARDMDYRLPAHVAAAFLAHGGEGPVLDVGAGTGLLGQALRAQGFADVIDGVDLSPGMLAKAREKGIYRRLFEADVTLPMPSGGWRGLVSSGTFTHGHVGPGAIGGLIDAVERGALLVLSVNMGIWISHGFDAALDALSSRIAPPLLIEVSIYGPAVADAAHAADRARIVLLRKS